MDQHPNTINSFRKYTRVCQHIEFLNACILHWIIPKFCQFSEKTRTTTQLSPQETASLEKRKLHHELEAQCLRADILKNNYENNLRILSLSSNSPTHFSNQINSIESFVKKSEQKYLFKRKQGFLMNWCIGKTKNHFHKSGHPLDPTHINTYPLINLEFFSQVFISFISCLVRGAEQTDSIFARIFLGLADIGIGIEPLWAAHFTQTVAGCTPNL